MPPAGEPAGPPAPHRRRRRRWWEWRLPFEVIGRAAANFSEDRGTLLAAAISYYALISLFPLTLLAVSIFGLVLRDETVHARVLDAIIAFLPIEGDTLERSLRRVAEIGPTLTIFSFLGAAWTAAAPSAAIRSTLNVVFDARQRRPFLRAKLIDYALLPIIALPLIGGVVLTGVLRLAREEVAEVVPVLEDIFGWAWMFSGLAIPFLLSFIAFLLIYWLLPNRPMQFRYVWPGAVLAALAFELLKSGFTFYLANFGNYDVIYGSLGSVIILLLWVFITANILVFGAEVAAEVPRVLYEEPRHGTTGDQGNWKASIWKLLKGLVMVPDEGEVAERAPGRAARDGRAPDQPEPPGRVSEPPPETEAEPEREAAARRNG